MRLLFLTSRLPFPPNRGDRTRTYHLLRTLSEEHEITLVSFVSSRDEAHMAMGLEAYCNDIHLVLRPTLRSTVSAAVNFWRQSPLQVLFYRSRKMQQLVDRLLNRCNFDAVYVHLFRMAPYLASHQNIYRIVDLTDIISAEIKASLPYRQPISRLIYSVEAPRIAAYEKQVADWAEETWLICDRDKNQLHEKSHRANIQTVPNGVDLNRYYPVEEQPKKMHLLFVGNMDVFHNVDAVSFLVNDIFPQVRRRIPEVTLDIIGAGKRPGYLPAGRFHNVNFRGYVPDLNQALHNAAVFVAPLRFSAGVQNKVLEAMAAGVPVVSTRNVCDGLGCVAGQDILVGESADELAAKIVNLLEDRSTCKRLGQAGSIFVRKRFSWQVAVERLNQIEQHLSSEPESAM